MQLLSNQSAITPEWSATQKLARNGLRASVEVRNQVSHPLRLDSGRSSNRNRHLSPSVNTSRHSGTNLSSASDLAILHSPRLNNCLTRLTQEKRVSRYPSADENGQGRTAGFATAVRQVSNGATARQPRFPPKRRPYSVDETGGVPLSMKV